MWLGGANARHLVEAPGTARVRVVNDPATLVQRLRRRLAKRR